MPITSNKLGLEKSNRGRARSSIVMVSVWMMVRARHRMKNCTKVRGTGESSTLVGGSDVDRSHAKRPQQARWTPGKQTTSHFGIEDFLLQRAFCHSKVKMLGSRTLVSEQVGRQSESRELKPSKVAICDGAIASRRANHRPSLIETGMDVEPLCDVRICLVAIL